MGFCLVRSEQGGGSGDSAMSYEKYTSTQLSQILQFIGVRPWESILMADQILSEIEGSNSEKSSTKFDEELTDKILEFSEFSRRAVSAILRQGPTKLPFSVLTQDFQAACAFKCKRRQFMIILLGGTSGCGKSTLSSLLASRFGLTTVLSTDQVRHLLRNFHTKIECPALYTSSYNTLEVLPDEVHGMTEEEKIIRGYTKQADLVFEIVEKMLQIYYDRKESIIIEGVHLSIDIMLRLLKKFPTHLLPILVCIKDRGKHESRFAVRAKYMTLDPEANKYVQYLQNIRIIQDFLMANAEKNYISVLDNSNVDRSIAILHRVLLNMISFMASSSSCVPLSTLDYKMQVYKQVKSAQEKSLQSKEVLDIIHAKLSRKHAVSDFGEIRYTKELMYHPPKRSKKEDLDLLQELSDAPSLEN